MKDIKFFNKVRISITSIEGYMELLKDSLSKAIIYSVILSLIVGSFLGVFSFFTAKNIENNIKSTFSSDEFKFRLENGILEFENSPIKIEKGRSMVYIDTNITLDTIESIRKIIIHKDESFSILRDGISYRINENHFNFKFSDFYLKEKIDNDSILKTLNILGIVKYISFFVSIILTFIKFMINAFILSVGGIILNKINNSNLKYREILKLCIYATTLPTILGIIIPIGTFSILISGIYFVLVLNYIGS